MCRLARYNALPFRGWFLTDCHCFCHLVRVTTDMYTTEDVGLPIKSCTRVAQTFSFRSEVSIFKVPHKASPGIRSSAALEPSEGRSDLAVTSAQNIGPTLSLGTATAVCGTTINVRPCLSMLITVMPTGVWPVWVGHGVLHPELGIFPESTSGV